MKGAGEPSVAENAVPAAESVAHLLGRDHRRLDAVLALAKQSLHAGYIARGRERFAEFRDGGGLSTLTGALDSVLSRIRAR